MRLPSFKRIYDNDYAQENRDLVRKLSNSLNIALENIYLALGNRLTLSDNFESTIKDIDIVVGSNGVPTGTNSFQLDKFGSTQGGSTARILGCIVLKAVNLTDNTAFLTSSPFISWVQTQTGIQIQHVTGLIPGNTYRLTIATLV